MFTERNNYVVEKVIKCKGKYTYDGKDYTLCFDNEGVKVFIDSDDEWGLICNNSLEILAILQAWVGQGFPFLQVTDIKDLD